MNRVQLSGLRSALLWLMAGTVILLMAAASPGSIGSTSALTQNRPVRDRPNIVFIMSDDHAAHAISAYGSKLIKTPNIDRLAGEGMLFENCFVTNSICTPSRAAILTGKYAHLNGVPVFNHIDSSQPMLQKYLQAAGYYTGMVGKWHLGGQNPYRPEDGKPTGFDYWNILPGQGAYFDPMMIEMGERKKLTGYTTDLITDLAIQFVQKRPAGKPFFLMYHHKAPHRNWQPDEKHRKQYENYQPPIPATFDDDYKGKSDAARNSTMHIDQDLNETDLKMKPPEGLSGAELKRWKFTRYLQDYLACVQSVDDNVGRFLDYLDQNGLAENTIVVYTSDQGFFLGEHNFYDKRFMYEEALRMPFLIRWPRQIKAGSVSRGMILNVDFAPTFLNAAGIKIPADMQGRSFLPLLAGKTPGNWRASMYYRYYHPGHHNVAAHYGIRTQRYKLIYFNKLDQWELYDLQNDPIEMHNLYADPAHAATVRRLKTELFRLKRDLRDTDQFQDNLPRDDVDGMGPPARTGMNGVQPARPNILWISAEDISPDLGAYGDGYAVTPNVDRLAAAGVRYANAFSTAPVCAPSRSAIITGMYPTTIGSMHMRSKAVPPAGVRAFTEYLRAAGYYCSNNSKTDYNFEAPPSNKPPDTAWDESSNTAHWRNRPDKSQPFFAVFNMTVTHESQIRAPEAAYRRNTARLKPEQFHDPAKAKLPPYYPDTPLVRRDWARYYDNMTAMDYMVGDILKQLEEDGLAESTIVFFWGDHGRGLPRGKRFVYDSGLRVPLIVRWPGRIDPGTVNDELVCLFDLGPTALSIAGIPIPSHMQAQAILGDQKKPPRRYAFAHRDRMDEAYDMSRSVMGKRYHYIRNFFPGRPYAQHIAYMEEMPTMKEWRRLYKDHMNALDPNYGRALNQAQLLFMAPEKPPEELYDLETDPDEIDNLARSPRHRTTLRQMRAALERWQKETGDLGLVPELELRERMRPGGVWQKVAAPSVSESAAGSVVRIKLASATEGASIAYTTDAGDKPHWLLYTRELTLSRPATMRFKACRLGFLDSEVVFWK